MPIKAKIKTLNYQNEFINSDDKFLAFVAGFGSGKSDAVAYRALRLARKRKKEGSKAVEVIIAPSYRILEDSNIIDFNNILGKYRIRNKYRDRDKKFILPEFDAEIWFRSADRPENIVGFDATDAILDEFDVQSTSKQKETWIKINSRLRGSGNSTIAIATTPEGFKQTYDLFYEKKIGRLITARTYQNTFLPDDYIWNNIFRIYGANVPEFKPDDLSWNELYLYHYSPLLAQYCGGEFVNVNGLAAYYGFDRSIHLVSHNSELVRNAINSKQYIIGMDFNVDPMSAVVSAWSGDKLVIFDEIILKNSHTEHMSKEIKRRYPDKHITVAPDLTGDFRKSAAGGVTDIMILKKAGFAILGAGKNNLVRDSLNTVNINFKNNKVAISQKCTMLVNDYEKVSLKSDGEIDKSDDSLTHISDASRYLIERALPIIKVKHWS